MTMIETAKAPQAQSHSGLLLDVKDLRVTFKTPDGDVTAVNDLNFTLQAGETLGIVGESGSGKSQTAFALMGLLAANGRIGGSATFNGRQILNLPERELNKLRAEQISMIFQDPMTSLNPYMRVGEQLMEVLMLHKGLSKAEAFEESVKMLDAVKMPEARKRMKMFPHEFSGGMRQRVMIAMALLCRPRLLIADEPTTALDVTVQAQIMTLLNELKREFNTAIIMITHDLGVVAGICDKVLVMYAGSHHGVRSGARCLLSTVAPILYWAVECGSTSGCGRRCVVDHSRQPTEPAAIAERLSIPAALPACHGAVQQRAAAGIVRARPPARLL